MAHYETDDMADGHEVEGFHVEPSHVYPKNTFDILKGDKRVGMMWRYEDDNEWLVRTEIDNFDHRGNQESAILELALRDPDNAPEEWEE